MSISRAELARRTGGGMTDDRPRDGYDLDAWIVARGLTGLQAAALFGVTDITMTRARKHGGPPWFGLPMLFRIADLIDLRDAETRAGIIHRPARMSRNQQADQPLHLIPLPPRRAVTLGDRIDARHTRRPEPVITCTMQAGDAAALLHALTALPDGGPRCHRAMRALHDAVVTAALQQPAPRRAAEPCRPMPRDGED